MQYNFINNDEVLNQAHRVMEMALSKVTAADFNMTDMDFIQIKSLIAVNELHQVNASALILIHYALTKIRVHTESMSHKAPELLQEDLGLLKLIADAAYTLPTLLIKSLDSEQIKAEGERLRKVLHDH
jgi:hypothetical protein